MSVQPQIVKGDLCDQPVEVIVNAWNRNVIPWWLLLPQGVSQAIKKRAGYDPFKELAKYGSIPLGQAVLTGAGRLPFKAIIHVAGINMFWRASEKSVRLSISNAIRLVNEHGFGSVAFPIIGAGSGSFDKNKALAIILDELKRTETAANVLVVRYEY